MNSVAFLFPGQGSQRPGMLRELRDDSERAQTYIFAQRILGIDLASIDTEGALSNTRAAQLALLIEGVSDAQWLASRNIQADFVAGHSVGAFAAAVAAGSLRFEDALALVDERGRAMSEASPHGFGMAAIVGVPEATVQSWIEAARDRGAQLYLTNRNAARQFAISGANAELDALVEFARKNGASKAVRLAVSVPSHSPLMNSVVEVLRTKLASVPIATPRIPYATNRDARIVRDASGIKEDLASNVAHPVRWSDIMSALYERGVRTFVEMRPGDVLTKIAQSSFDDVRAFSLADTPVDQIAAYLQSMKR